MPIVPTVPIEGTSQYLIPWEPCNFPIPIQNELDRRKLNRSFAYVAGEKGGWDNKDGDWNKYRGPMSPWVRCCSNGKGRETQTDSNGNPILDKNGNSVKLEASKIKPGFVFFGGKDFYSGYGFNNQTNDPSIIGYVPDGTNRTHTIDNDLLTNDYPIHVPPPEIEKIQVTIQKEHYRRVTMEWTCFSLKQLEYMTPYFLVPGISCIIEWGWNHYDPRSLLDLAFTPTLHELFANPYPLYTKHILQSRGNYDVIFGIITQFDWSVEGNKIKCKTEVTSKDRIYAGLLVDARPIYQDNKSDIIHPLGKLTEFVNNVLTQFKSVNSSDDINLSIKKMESSINKQKEEQKLLIEDPHVNKIKDTKEKYNAIANSSIKLIRDFIDYVQRSHRNNWEEYIYGVFYGRDKNTKSPLQIDANTTHDFDYKSGGNKELWINLGLVIEAINFHSAPLTMNGEEMFRTDIDDVIIGGHPNMISSDGGICLIPNAEAPKYFYGAYGPELDNPGTSIWGNITKEFVNKILPSEEPHDKTALLVKNIKQVLGVNPEDWEQLKPCTNDIIPYLKNTKLADRRVYKVCMQLGAEIRRDNLDEIINRIRYEHNFSEDYSTYEFPFIFDRNIVPGSKPYPARYSGFLKDIYVNVNLLIELLNQSDNIKTYTQFIEKIMERISSACGNFWDFRLVDATGAYNLPDDAAATMKIVDYKFMAFANRGPVYSFDYMDADSLLLGMGFKPTLSNAQAIRSIYAQTNNPDNSTTITNGNNELLDYHFKDRLFRNNGSMPLVNRTSETFRETMRSLQQIIPPADDNKNTYQITNTQNGEKIIRRLVLPDPEVLQMLLDDGDEENNPKYTGVMPGIQANFTIQGIGGLRTFMMFLVRNLPEPYSHKNIVFRIVDVQETIESGKWVTTITAGIIPLRGWIKKRLGITT